jgi:hypothetical protein
MGPFTWFIVIFFAVFFAIRPHALLVVAVGAVRSLCALFVLCLAVVALYWAVIHWRELVEIAIAFSVLALFIAPVYCFTDRSPDDLWAAGKAEREAAKAIKKQRRREPRIEPKLTAPLDES